MENKSSVNIPKDSTDPFCRYKRPIINTVLLAKNGGTTVWTNIKEVSKSLNRTVEMMIVYFRKSLKCSIQSKDEQVMFRGKFDTSQLEKIIEMYIAKCVLCNICHNPETNIRASKQNSDQVVLTCRACGSKNRVDL